MKKILIALGVLFILGVTAVFIACSMFIGAAIREGVNTFGPEITQTELSVEDVSVSPLTGTSSLKGLILGNPEGFDGEKALSLEYLKVDIDYGTVFTGDALRIKQIHIKAPSVAYEKSFRSSNIAEIQKSVETFSERLSKKLEEGMDSDTAEAPAETSPASDTELIKVIIDEVIIEGGSVGLVLAGNTVSVPLPSITLTEIGTSQGGIGPDEAIVEILNAFIRSVGQATAGAGKAVIQGGADGVKGVASGVKNLFGGGE